MTAFTSLQALSSLTFCCTVTSFSHTYTVPPKFSSMWACGSGEKRATPCFYTLSFHEPNAQCNGSKAWIGFWRINVPTGINQASNNDLLSSSIIPSRPLHMVLTPSNNEYSGKPYKQYTPQPLTHRPKLKNYFDNSRDRNPNSSFQQNVSIQCSPHRGMHHF